MTSPWVRNVDETNFAALVLEASHDVPVLVDFWAAWCGPCRALAPVLESIADDMNGKLIVAKIDTDAQQALATRFQIRGIPACKLFIDGAVADEFVGALPESRVREFLKPHIKSELDSALAAARAARVAGDLELASERIAALVAAHPKKSAIRLEAAQLSLARGDVESLRAHAGLIGLADDEHEMAQALLGAAELLETCKSVPECPSQERADDAEALYTRGACLAISGRYQEALDAMLDVVRRDRRFKDDAGRKAMLTIFSLCDNDDLVRDYRRRLGILI